MSKLVWIGLFIAAVGEYLFWVEGYKGNLKVSSMGFLIMGVGAVVTGIGLLKMHLAEKRGF
ncbi:MAG: hypothetical protein KHX55_01525 [Proteobacteria bacterium]|nr:hypothetical protein [Pseudomonadota bacterium]